MKPDTHFLNVDLDVVSGRSLARLTQALKRSKVVAINERTEPGAWLVGYEASLMNADAEACVKALLDAVEQLPPAIKALWTGCTKRDFNLGFACGATPCFELSLSSETLKRIADQRASVTVTLYPSATEPTP